MKARVFQVADKASLATVDGWQSYVKRNLRRPERISRSAYLDAPPNQRRRYDDARFRYHRSLGEFQTPQMILIHDAMDMHVLGAEDSPPIAAGGVMVSGPPRAGKTTTLITWAKRYERRLRDLYGWGRTSLGERFVPVAYWLVGENAGPRAMMRNVLDGYGEPWKDGWGTGTLTGQFARLAHRCGTSVVVIDQMQNLKLSNQSDREVAAHLKELMDRCPEITFCGAGIGLDRSGLFTEGKSKRDEELAQIGGRFALMTLRPASTDTPAGRAEWVSLLRTIESKLILFGGRSGDLCAELADYIHWRTGGITGEVMHLLRVGANHAIIEHAAGRAADERITEELLEGITLSRHAEQTAGRLPSTRDEESFVAVRRQRPKPRRRSQSRRAAV